MKSLRIYAALAIVSILAACTGAFDVTTEDAKAFLQSPLMLFILMYAGSAASAAKQLGVARAQGSDMTWGQYLSYWPQTVAIVISNALAFIVLLQSDTLNLASALAVGFSLNSSADAIQPKTGRSGGVAATTTGRSPS